MSSEGPPPPIHSKADTSSPENSFLQHFEPSSIKVEWQLKPWPFLSASVSKPSDRLSLARSFPQSQFLIAAGDGEIGPGLPCSVTTGVDLAYLTLILSGWCTGTTGVDLAYLTLILSGWCTGTTGVDLTYLTLILSGWCTGTTGVDLTYLTLILSGWCTGTTGVDLTYLTLILSGWCTGTTGVDLAYLTLILSGWCSGTYRMSRCTKPALQRLAATDTSRSEYRVTWQLVVLPDSVLVA
ncbi:hypothetical protein BaRGS_00006379 [Batillaria attramentaria]|uniref:Uncharacterized protein n=1 Tax=Batillaria attramentaria TaxID=370345 RepID=A0ABD0LTN5_9CAEN